jgi:signal transduction histidine kinase
MLAVLAMCLSAFAALGQEAKPSADEVKALTVKATQLVLDKGIDAARAVFYQDGEFKHGEIYVNVLDTKGAWVVYPPKPEGVGKVIINLQDADGRFLVQDILKMAAENGEGWVEYRWKNPVSNKIQLKQSYVKKVSGTDYVVYVGVYK